jgi:predicted nucleic acid-binding protein
VMGRNEARGLGTIGGDPALRVACIGAIPAPESLYASILTLAEILRGIELLPESKRRVELEQWLHDELPKSLDRQRVLPITKAIADRWAVFAAKLQLKGRHIDVIDGLWRRLLLNMVSRLLPAMSKIYLRSSSAISLLR